MVFVQPSLKALRRRSTFQGAARTTLELKKVGEDGGVTGAAADVTTAVVRAALSGSFDGARGSTRG